MRLLSRIDPILEKIGKIWKQHQDLRLGQLLLNVVRDPELYYIEDDELIKRVEKFYKRTLPAFKVTLGKEHEPESDG